MTTIKEYVGTVAVPPICFRNMLANLDIIIHMTTIKEYVGTMAAPPGD